MDEYRGFLSGIIQDSKLLDSVFMDGYAMSQMGASA